MSSLALLPPGYLPSGWLSQMITAVRLRQIGGAIGFTALLLTLLPPSTRNLTRPPDKPVAAPRMPPRLGRSAAHMDQHPLPTVTTMDTSRLIADIVALSSSIRYVAVRNEDRVELQARSNSAQPLRATATGTRRHWSIPRC